MSFVLITRIQKKEYINYEEKKKDGYIFSIPTQLSFNSNKVKS